MHRSGSSVPTNRVFLEGEGRGSVPALRVDCRLRRRLLKRLMRVRWLSAYARGACHSNARRVNRAIFCGWRDSGVEATFQVFGLLFVAFLKMFAGEASEDKPYFATSCGQYCSLAEEKSNDERRVCL